MSRKNSAGKVKLTTKIIETQDLDTLFKASDISFETLEGEKNLHLPLPIPTFECHEPKNIFANVPTSILVIAQNFKSINVRNVILKVFVKDVHGVIAQHETTADELETNGGILSLRIDFLPPKVSQIEVSAFCSYLKESSRSEKKNTVLFDVLRPVILTYKTLPAPANLLQFTVKNALPQMMHNVSVTTDNNDVNNITAPLVPDDVYSGIIRLTQPCNSLTVSFTLPNCPRAFINYQIATDKKNRVGNIHV